MNGVIEVYITDLWGTSVSDADQMNRLAVTFGVNGEYSIVPGSQRSLGQSRDYFFEPVTRRRLGASTGVSFKLLFPSTDNGGGGLTQSSVGILKSVFADPVVINANLVPFYLLTAKQMGVSNYTLGGASFVNTSITYTLASGSPLTFLADYSVAAAAAPAVLIAIAIAAGYYYFKHRKNKTSRLPTYPLSSIAP